MSTPHPSRPRLHAAMACRAIFLILLVGLLVFPSNARAPGIQDIQSGDMIFIYEQGLDLSGLRTGANPVTSLRKYTDDNPAKTLVRDVPVQDDTSFDPLPALFGDERGVFYAWNPTDGTMGSVFVAMPSVSVEVVLADPYHADVVSGFSISPTTRVAFKITSTDVGSSYHAGALYPATIDLVFTSPGGGQLTTFQGKDFSGMSVNSAVFYTDDPGRPGAIDFDGLESGAYSVQAKWKDPASFDQQAPDSNIFSFTIGAPTAAPTTPQPVTTVITTRTTVVTTSPTTTVSTPPASPPAELPTTAVTTPPATPSPAGTTAAPAPTAAPTMAMLAVLSPALAFLLLGDRKCR